MQKLSVSVKLQSQLKRSMKQPGVGKSDRMTDTAQGIKETRQRLSQGTHFPKKYRSDK
jgi:hypothetical protein